MSTSYASIIKKEEIINIASVLFSQNGYKGTTIAQIADKANLHKTSLFHYFKNKESILLSVMDQSLEDHLNILDKIVTNPKLTGIEKLKLGLEHQVQVTCKYKHHINVYLNEIKSLSPKNRKKYNDKRKKNQKYFEKIIKEISDSDSSTLFNGLNVKLINLAILGMCNWIIKWYDENGPSTPKEIFETFFAIITNC